MIIEYDIIIFYVINAAVVSAGLWGSLIWFTRSSLSINPPGYEVNTDWGVWILPSTPVWSTICKARVICSSVSSHFFIVIFLNSIIHLNETFLSGNGYIIGAQTKSKFLQKTPTSPYSLESNGMAETFIKTFKRDYVAFGDILSAERVMEQLTASVI